MRLGYHTLSGDRPAMPWKSKRAKNLVGSTSRHLARSTPFSAGLTQAASIISRHAAFAVQRDQGKPKVSKLGLDGRPVSHHQHREVVVVINYRENQACTGKPLKEPKY